MITSCNAEDGAQGRSFKKHAKPARKWQNHLWRKSIFLRSALAQCHCTSGEGTRRRGREGKKGKKPYVQCGSAPWSLKLITIQAAKSQPGAELSQKKRQTGCGHTIASTKEETEKQNYKCLGGITVSSVQVASKYEAVSSKTNIKSALLHVLPPLVT